MSAAGKSAATGAASGAAAGSVVGPWGTAIGAAVGGVGGYLKGRGADKKAKAQGRALRALRDAEARYSSQVQDIVGEQERVGREVTLGGQQRQLAHLAGFGPRNIPGASGRAADAFTGRIQQGMAGAPAPATAPGYPTQYLQALEAEALARIQAGMGTTALQHGLADVGQREDFQRMAAVTGELPDARRLEDLRAMGGVRRGMAYEDYTRALQAAGLQAQRAERAGSGQMLAGGLVDAAGSLALGGAMSARRPQPQPQPGWI